MLRLVEPSSGGFYASWALAGFLPGALGGALVGGLLFFLNPEQPFAPVPVIRTLALFAVVFGILSLLCHIPLSSAPGLRPWRLLPWTLTAVLGAAALLDWVHASHFSFYLPPALGNRLIKAALWLSLAALFSFYTALLHTVQGRPYGIRSRLLLALFSCLAVVLTLERRAAFQPLSKPTPRSVVTQALEQPRLLVVGIDGATLEAILPLTEQGQLPFLANLMQQGAYGRLVSIDPIVRLPVWFSLASGQYPFKHGIVSETSVRAPFLSPGGRLSLLPAGLGMSKWGPLLGLKPTHEPPQARSPALWEFLEGSGIATAVVGWPAPDASLAGCDVVVSEIFFRRLQAAASDTRPEILRQALDSRVTPETIDPSLYARFGPNPPQRLRQVLAEDLWREAVARRLLASSPAQAVFLNLPGLLEVARSYFGGYMAVQFEGLQDARLEEASRIITTYYALLDEALERLWNSLAAPRLLVVVSAWGADEPGAWQRVLSTVSGGRRAVAGRFSSAPDGVLMLLGENLNSGTFLDRAQLIDVAPTLLYGLGLPLPSSLDGKVLTKSFGGTFLNRTPLTFVSSYPRPATSEPEQ